MNNVGLRGVWTTAGILWVVAAIALAVSMTAFFFALDPTWMRIIVIPRYAVAIAVLLLAWGGTSRRSILTAPTTGWLWVVAFVATPFITGLVRNAVGMPRGLSVGGGWGDVPAFVEVGIVSVAGLILMQQACASGLIPPRFHRLVRTVVIVWVVAQVLALTPVVGLAYFTLSPVAASVLAYIVTVAIPALAALTLGIIVLVSARQLDSATQTAPLDPAN